MDQLKKCLKELTAASCEDVSSMIYSTLSNFKLLDHQREEFIQDVIPRIYDLLETGKLRKDILFISLLVNQPILNILLEHEASLVKLDFENPKSVFNYVYYKKKHWLLKVLNSVDSYHTTFADVHEMILILKIIFITNQNYINIEELSCYLGENFETVDPFFRSYIDSLNFVLKVVKFIRSETDLSDTDIFKLLTKETLLECVSQLINIGNPSMWSDISSLLAENEEFNRAQFPHLNNNESTYIEQEIFVAFTILSSTINCVKFSRNISKNGANKDDITAELEVIKEKLINLTNRALQIDLLEDIFTLIFLRSSDLGEDQQSDSFFCGENEIRLILSLLRSVLEDLKKQYSNRVFAGFKRFVDLNKYITDGYWRLELLNSIKKNWYLGKDGDIRKNDILHYMLASPEALINMCLKRNNIEKAIQVVKIFGLEKSVLANEIQYSIAFTNLRKSIESAMGREEPVTAIISKHATSLKSITDNLHIRKINSNQIVVDILDVLATVPLRHSTIQELVTVIDAECEDNALLPSFFNKAKQMNADHYYPINEILLSCNSVDIGKFDEEHGQYAKLAKAYDDFRLHSNPTEVGTLNFNHALHKVFVDIQGICAGFGLNVSDTYISYHRGKTLSDHHEAIGKDRVQYMQKVLKYLKAFSKILLLEQNNTDLISKGFDTSLFEILKHKRVDLICKLIYERQVDGVDFDYIFGKMKLDLTYHIAACSFPKVNLNRRNGPWKDVQLFKPRKDVINYIQKRNWLLAFMINVIYGTKDEKIDSSEIRIRTLGNLMQLKDVQNLKQVFNDSEILTVLQKDFCTFITDEVDCIATGDLFTPILLKLPETRDWKQLYDLVSSVNETRIDNRIQKLRDMILCNLIKSRDEPEYYKYIRRIVDSRLRMQILLEEFHHWPADFCVDMINFETSLSDSDVSELQNWRKKIQLYAELTTLFDCTTWFEIHQLCESSKEEVLNKLLGTHNIDYLIDFLDTHPIDDEMLVNIDSSYFVPVFANQRDDKAKIKVLFEKLPQEHLTNTCRCLLKLLKCLDDLEFVLACLKGKSDGDESILQNLEVALEILSHFAPEEQQQFLCLMEDPLSILEVLLMNTRLEKLGQILQCLQLDARDVEDDESVISVGKVDELLRKYAEKSVDFKVVTLPPSSSVSESKLMQSIDSLSLERKIFVMPDNVPSREDWISDDIVKECMCCSQITFSMFNRRHHCRRCGRVICWNCSLKKMNVETYGDILVRVCKDCFKQSRDMESDSDSLQSGRSRLEDFWILTDDPNHNAIVREEFSYENAPSVLLCLSILKYHSKSDLYPRFLLNQCENILQILHPIKSYFEVEIDFNLIINMLKSLAVAAKVVSNQCMLQWGASLADKMISQAEMLGLLAEKGYLHLLSSRSQNVHIDANILRHVRDKLLELEQWHLALEVSTKAGLDTAAVFAKWGKSFLIAGNLQLARLKFQMCFEKCSKYEAPDYNGSHESFSNLCGNKSFHQSRSSLNTNPKPSKTPLLLNEIIQILESKTEKISLKVLKSLPSSKTLYDSASSLQSNPNASPVRSEDSVSIINKLQSLNAIANGIYSSLDTCGDLDTKRGPHLENIFYEECIYYLEKYGSHSSLCHFFIRHNEFRRALEYIVENDVGVDIFIEIYVTCLKDGRIDNLQENMLAIDPVLDIWKNYIRHICIHLEKQQMLHSLYQLQQFIGDFVRAAMTCIKFYCHEVSSFEEFDNRVEYLRNAQDHLKQELEQEQWVDVQSVSSVQSRETFEEKSINNPALVMKLDAKEIGKHIVTIELQMEVVRFLSNCEKYGTSVVEILADIQFPSNSTTQPSEQNLPTLFGSLYDKMQLAILCIIAGENVEDGFGIASRVIHNYKLKAVKIYCQSGRVLAKAKRHSAVSSLVKCIRSGGEKDSVLTDMCDEMLALTARTLGDYNATDTQLEDIIKHISNRSVKINSYIETKQLRSAFLLAAKFSRVGDIRRISREAELYNRADVKKLCQKYLQIQEHGSSRNNS